VSGAPGSPAAGLPSIVRELARAVEGAGGRLVVVGGWIRDQLLGRASKDLDLEVFGLAPERIDALLAGFGSSGRVGRQFPVWRLHEVDLALPRAGVAEYDPARPDSIDEAFRQAARHRDLRVNAIGWEPLEGRWIDPWCGRADLEDRRLRAVDSATFGADPLRLLRVARFEATLEARAEEALVATCRRLDTTSLPAERVAGELRRILLEPECPSRAFRFLERCERLDIVPPIAALRGVPQDPFWHPEGDVFVHTLMVVDQAAGLDLAGEGSERERLLWAALCHDLGKPEATRIEGERVLARGHEAASARITRAWLEDLRLPSRLIRAVEALVRHHLAPGQLVSQSAGPNAYRRLARRLAPVGLGLVALERLARVDRLGRTTAEARTGRFEAGERFLEAARAARVEVSARPEVVRAADLMARGLVAGPALGRALDRARELQDEHGWESAEPILRQLLAEGMLEDAKERG
jgi:tRNA nucleotidyltransferase (CCA-adding enzyme)